MDRRTLKGIAAIVVSAFGFALMGMCVRMTDLYGEEISAFQKSFFRNAVALAIALGMFLKMRSAECGVRSAGPRALPVLLLRSVFGTLGIFANFYAIGKINLADAMMLNKLAPFFTVLFSWLFLKERVTLRQMLCLIGAIAGAALVIKPGFGGGDLFALFCGLFGGIAAGAAYTCVR